METGIDKWFFYNAWALEGKGFIMLKKKKYISTCSTALAGGFKLQMSDTNSDEHFLTLYQSIYSKPNT